MFGEAAVILRNLIKQTTSTERHRTERDRPLGVDSGSGHFVPELIGPARDPTHGGHEHSWREQSAHHVTSYSTLSVAAFIQRR
jgi:hypothetical protein